MQKAQILGYYIKKNRRAPTKGVVYNPFGRVAPCLTAGMGGGGNTVPTIMILCKRKKN